LRVTLGRESKCITASTTRHYSLQSTPEIQLIFYGVRAISVAAGEVAGRGVSVDGGIVEVGVRVCVKVGIGVFVEVGVAVDVRVAVAVDVGVGVREGVEVLVGRGVGVPNRVPPLCAI
jgi:hypothetical protein